MRQTDRQKLYKSFIVCIHGRDRNFESLAKLADMLTLHTFFGGG